MYARNRQSPLCVYSMVWISKCLDFVDPDLENFILKISIMMGCTPEIGNRHSVCTPWSVYLQIYRFCWFGSGQFYNKNWGFCTNKHSSLVCINKSYTLSNMQIFETNSRLKHDFNPELDPGTDPDPDKSLRFHNIASSYSQKYCITSTANWKGKSKVMSGNILN